MRDTDDMERLFQYAGQYDFDDFNALYLCMAKRLPSDLRWEANLLRLQIRLYAADENLADDLRLTARFDMMPRFSCLNNIWRSDTPNRFNVFRCEPGSLCNFLKSLPAAAGRMQNWYGEVGGAMVNQIRCEIFYFMGRFDEAIALALTQESVSRRNHTDAIYLQSVLYRCYLAKGQPGEAQRCMLAMISLAEVNPECFGPYHAIRTWANLTTGWSGDTPRYREQPDGSQKPILDDRLDAIRGGFARTSPLERPFVEYAGSGSRQIYTMRQFYMIIFQALYWFQTKEYRQTELYFAEAYRIMENTGLITPFLEYGHQIVPLLEYAGGNIPGCSRNRIMHLSGMAKEYEEGLLSYRTINA